MNDTEKLAKLRDTYNATQTLITTTIGNHEDVEDYIRGIRAMMKAMNNPEMAFHVQGLTDTLEYMRALKRITQSYHKAVGNAIQEVDQ